MQRHARDITSLFTTIDKGITTQHVQALNVTHTGNMPLDRIIPEDYIPPKEWQNHFSAISSATTWYNQRGKLNNGATRPGHKEFCDRAKELAISNDDAFSSLQGGPAFGKASSTRVAQFRNFYLNLFKMAEYWDTSQDNYATVESIDGSKEEYTGRRLGTGTDMPPEHRSNTVVRFVETIAWTFRCSIQPENIMTNKFIRCDRYLPIVGLAGAVMRTPTEREKARKQILEGPLIPIQCRNTTTFRNKEDPIGEGQQEITDLLYEIGAVLLVAQKRAREGKEEDHRWKDQWWAEKKRRHLGDLGGGKQDRETNARARRESEAAARRANGSEPMEGIEMGTESRVQQQQGLPSEIEGSKKRKLRPNVQAYLDSKPPEPMWEAKVDYQKIGKEPGAGADDVSVTIHQNSN